MSVASVRASPALRLRALVPCLFVHHPCGDAGPRAHLNYLLPSSRAAPSVFYHLKISLPCFPPRPQVTFDEKSPQELLQILNDVCAALDSVHERDVRDEAPDQLGFRLVSFLAVLKFPLPPDVYVILLQHL